MVIKRPLTLEQKKILENKSKPSQDDILAAQDDLFMYLMTRIAELESQLDERQFKSARKGK